MSVDVSKNSVLISLSDFLSRLDENKRITETHYMFPNGDGGDDNEELFTRKCFVNIPTESKSRSIQKFNAYRSSLLSLRPNAVKGISAKMVVPLFFGVIRIVIQVLRPFIVLGSFCFPVSLLVLEKTTFVQEALMLLREEVVNMTLVEYLTALFFSHSLIFSTLSFGIGIILCWSLFEDVNFKRAYCGYTTKVVEGIYFKETDSRYAESVLKSSPRFADRIPYSCTPYLTHGDHATLVPLTYDPPLYQFSRRFLRTLDDESIALDFAIPETGLDLTKPFFLCLHGLNGGSNEPYVLDFAHRALARGYGSACLIARGMMGIPVVKGKMFNGARTDDLALAIRTLRHTFGAELNIVLVGFSMGGIIVSNYMARLSEKVGVRAAIVMSASCDATLTPENYSSRRIWQSPLAFTLKVNTFMPVQPWILSQDLLPQVSVSNSNPTSPVVQTTEISDPSAVSTVSDLVLDPEALTKFGCHVDIVSPKRAIDIEAALKTTCMYEFDCLFSARYLGHTNAIELYKMSSAVYAHGYIEGQGDGTRLAKCDEVESVKQLPTDAGMETDNVSKQSYYNNEGRNGLSRIRYPILFLNAADDPVVGVDGVQGAIEETAHNDNIFVKVTAHGGHVGWPTSVTPRSDKDMFEWNHALVFEFAEAVLSVQKQNNHPDAPLWTDDRDELVVQQPISQARTQILERST